MPSAYLQSGDYAAYGVASATAADVTTASALIDAFLKRPEGLVWTPDAVGLPCFMAALSPTFSFTAPGSIAAGASVVVPVTGGMINADLVGEVLVLERGVSGKTEACVVSGIGPGSITLQSVGLAHSAGAALDAGLVILEERSLPSNRAVSRVAKSPVARMLSVQGRYAYGRRSQQQAGVFAEPTMLASVQAFGGPPTWYAVNVADVSVSQGTGEVFIPPGLMVANFSDVRMRYVAGWAQANVPGAIKSACASLVAQVQAFPELVGSIKSFAAGGTKIERFADTQLDASAQAMLLPYQAQNWF